MTLDTIMDSTLVVVLVPIMEAVIRCPNAEKCG
jgi:hypothetical protein